MSVEAASANDAPRRRAVMALPGAFWGADAVVMVVVAALLAVTPASAAPTVGDIVFGTLLFVLIASLSTVGALLAVRRPANVVGWLLLVSAQSIAAALLLTTYAQYRSATSAGPPGAIAAPVLSNAALEIGLVVTGLVIPVFPTGALARRGRAIVAVICCGVVLSVLGGILWTASAAPVGAAASAPAIDAMHDVFPFVEAFGNVLLTVGFVLAAADMIGRLRAARGDERRQYQWFTYVAAILAAALTVGSLPIGAISQVAWVVAFGALAALPVAIAIAILKYNLYGIDTLINRTLVYVPLVAIVGGLYAAGVAVSQRFFLAITGTTSDAAVVLATLVVAGVFAPIKQYLEGTVDRRFRPVAALVAQPSLPSTPDLGLLLRDPRFTATIESVARRVVAEEARARSADRTSRGASVGAISEADGVSIDQVLEPGAGGM
jgi:hypothetical protein